MAPSRVRVSREATDLLTAYVECAALLKWLVEHDGECLADNPKALAKARDALARTNGLSEDRDFKNE
jgi:hypothetical protein